MATQLKQTDLHPIPFQQPKPNIRVVFSAGAAQTAVRAHMANKPGEVRESTLDELGAEPVSWTALYETVQNAIAARERYHRDRLEPACQLHQELIDAGADSSGAMQIVQKREDEYGVFVSAVSRTIDDLVRYPAPNFAALISAIRIGVEENLFGDEGDEIAGILADSIERLSSCVTLENSAIVNAFEAFRDALLELHTPRGALSDSAVDVLNARMDEADMVLKLAPAITSAGVLMKLKRAFNGIVVHRWSDHALLQPQSPEFEHGLDLADLYSHMMWSAIEDLERISTAATTQAADPHRYWLGERNQLIAYLNAGDAGPPTEEEISVGCGQLNEFDNRILDTPAETADGLLAQMVLVAQLSVEGHEVDETTTAALLTQARKVVGLGTLAGASNAIQEQFA